jgi:hypothetical protein
MTARWIPFVLLAVLGAARPALPQVQEHFAVSAAQVALAVSASGMPIAADHVSLLTRVVATEPEPALDVLSVETLGGGSPDPSGPRLRIKLACHVAGECLPFYAIVSSPLSPTVRARALPPPSGTVWTTRNQITMKAGTHATLILNDQRSQIEVAVVSLENGIAGHRIHVASLDHKQTYIAEVVNEHLLKGSF